MYESNRQRDLQLILDNANDEKHFLKKSGYDTDKMTIEEVYEIILVLKREAKRIEEINK